MKKFSTDGFTLVETLIAAAILSGVILTYFQARGRIFEQEEKISAKYDSIRTILLIKDDILKNDSYFVPNDYKQDLDTFNLTEKGQRLGVEELVLFDSGDVTKRGYRCYDLNGVQIDLSSVDPTTFNEDLDCRFKVHFFKAKVVVPGRANSPIHQYHIRVRYVVDVQRISGADPVAVHETLYFRPFKTGVLYF